MDVKGPCEDVVPKEPCFPSARENTQLFKLKHRVHVFLLGFGQYVVLSRFVLETPLGRPEQPAHVSNLLSCDKITFLLAPLLGLVGHLLLPCPSKLPTSQGTSIVSAYVFSPLPWQDEGSLTPMNIDSEIPVYHLPCY